MDDLIRDRENIADYMKRASHAQLVVLAEAFGREMLARGIYYDVEILDFVTWFRRQKSRPRAEPLTRPADEIDGYWDRR